MKKLLYLLFAITLITFISCSDDAKEEDCGCVKTSYHRYFRTTSSNSSITVETGKENVYCQEQESQVVTAEANGGEYWYYVICCDNIDEPNSSCN